MSKPIGILGGSFDPVHYGHLRLALECKQSLELEKVIFVPLNLPSHRAPLQASANQRYQMLQLATKGIKGLEVTDIEIKRNNTSYTIDTLKELRETYCERSICLIIGMDAFQEFDTWKEWQKIAGFAHIIITNRPNTQQVIKKERLKTFYESRKISLKENIHNSLHGKILKQDVPALDISSSQIRELMQSNNSIKFLLPDNVLEFITNEKIY
ncbi:MAG: nicotinate-nucleotide adenylyltransferase [Gammaproteobacteria bacterium]|jgi:nicotinate-nucleotide adenylyltransferase